MVAPVEAMPEAEVPIRALAVLPLADLAADRSQEYLADGLTDALITSLSKIRALKVISRTSAMRYRNTEKSLPAIARELGVQALVEGSVLRSGDRVWVTVQLVNAATDAHLWSESYERDVGDVPALLDEVAGTIADAVRVTVSPDERTRLMGRCRVAPAAYEAFLRGVHFMQRYTPADTDRSIAQLQEAVRQDPSYAWAHAALAGAYIMRAIPFGVGMPVAEQRRLMALAKAAGERALQLDETLAVAHAMLASALLLQEWDWRRAREALDQAIRLEPSSSSAHALRAMAGACLMERDVTRREAERAVELDPLNLGQRAQVAETLYWARDYEGAIQGAVEVLAFDPAFPRAHFVLGRVYEAQGRMPEAIEHYRKAGLLTAHQAKAARSAFRRGGTLGFHRWALQVGFGAQGGPATGTGAPLRPLWKAKLHCQAGNLDEAIAYLEQAYAGHEGLLILIHVDIFDPLHGDPRFEDLVRRVGLPSFPPARDGGDLPA